MVNLSEYTWAFKSNLDKALLAPKDAVILMLKDGPVPRKALIQALRTWRPVANPVNYGDGTIQRGPMAFYTYLFNASYHNVANSIKGDTSENYRRRSAKFDSAFWYRIQPGVYALTLSGIKRLHQLGY